MILLISRRYIKVLKDVSVVPWLIAMVVMVVRLLGSIPNAPSDYEMPSFLPGFLQTQTFLTLGLIFGFGLLAWKLHIDESNDDQQSS